MVNSVELIDTTEHLTLWMRCRINRCRYKRVRLYFVSIGDNCGGVRRDEFIDNAAKDITERIPPQYDVARTRRIYELKLTPTFNVLLQELERFNMLLETMRKTLELLRKASDLHVK